MGKPTNSTGLRNAHAQHPVMHESDLSRNDLSLVLLKCGNSDQGIRFLNIPSSDGILEHVSLLPDLSNLGEGLPSEVKTMGLSGREGSESTNTSAKPSAMLLDSGSSLPVTLSTSATSTVRT